MVRDEAQLSEVREKITKKYGLKLIPGFRCDFRDPFGNRIQVVDLHDESLVWLLRYQEVQKAGIKFSGWADLRLAANLQIENNMSSGCTIGRRPRSDAKSLRFGRPGNREKNAFLQGVASLWLRYADSTISHHSFSFSQSAGLWFQRLRNSNHPENVPLLRPWSRLLSCSEPRLWLSIPE